MTPITFKNLRKLFGKTVAVDGVHLQIPAGSLFFLLGPSGCGKTTLLRMIAGFTEPTSGNLLFGDRDVTRVPANKRNCGMVFQGYALWPHMTVAQNVAFGLGVRNVPASERDKRVSAALKTVQMQAYASRKPNELSGGQQQRVALARALVIEPTVLLLDEPLSNLDAKLRLEMRGEIKRICKQADITAVYVTHDQKEALSMADRVAVLRDGKLVQQGAPRELYHRPRSRFVADFLGETNFVQAQILSKHGGRVTLECPAGTLHAGVFPDNLPSRGNVVCSIRPEAIKLVSNGAASGSGGRFTAKRTDLVYLGEMAQHHLVIGEDTPIKAFELNPSMAPPTGGPDAPVEVTFDAEDVVILDD